MAESAHVISLDSMKLLKRALWKFQEHATVALGEAESDMQRTLNWLETEQRSYWIGEVRKRETELSRAKEALRMKQVFKDSTGGRQSVVDEMKAVQIATRRLEEAMQKVAAVKKSISLLQREIMNYKGQVQRFATAVQSELPQAAHELERVIANIEAYAAVGVGSPEMATSQADAGPSMKRAVDEPDAADKAGDAAAVEPSGPADAATQAQPQAEADQPPSAQDSAGQPPAADTEPEA